MTYRKTLTGLYMASLTDLKRYFSLMPREFHFARIYLCHVVRKYTVKLLLSAASKFSGSLVHFNLGVIIY